MMLRFTKFFLWIIVIGFGIIALYLFFAIVFNDAYFNHSHKIDTKLASDFGQFFGGFVGTMFAISGTLLILVTLISQIIENKKNQVTNHFFKMLDYHNENVRQITVSHVNPSKDEKSEGRRAFVIFKLQLRELLSIVDSINKKSKLDLTDEQIIDIAYIAFYYGLDNDWEDFSEDKFSRYEDKALIMKKLLKEKGKSKLKIGRTNQTSLSSYFRNMYNAIKMVDRNKYLTKKEKVELIKILRAQLSNPELYVLFFNLVSRFGKKWKDRKLIIKYEFVKNIPNGYCERFNPNDFFPMIYEENELNKNNFA